MFCGWCPSWRRSSLSFNRDGRAERSSLLSLYPCRASWVSGPLQADTMSWGLSKNAVRTWGIYRQPVGHHLDPCNTFCFFSYILLLLANTKKLKEVVRNADILVALSNRTTLIQKELRLQLFAVSVIIRVNIQSRVLYEQVGG